MIRPIHAPLLLGPWLAVASAADEPAPDLLRLTNGELEGRFGGIDRDGVLRWERDDGIAPMEFRTDKIRQVILRGARSERVDASTSHIELINGDRIPGVITGLDETNLTLESETAGALVIPRDTVKRVAPNPFGGRLIYAGPFDPDEWKLDNGKDPKPEADAGEAEPAEEAAEAPTEKAPEADEKEAGWRHLGSRWYRVSGDEAITLDAGMPDQSVFRFRMEWRGRSSVSVGFHADFAPRPVVEQQEPIDGEGQNNIRRIVSSTSGLTNYFGRSLVMSLRGNYVNLYRCGYGKDGEPFVNSLRASNRTLQIEDVGEADFEIRSDLRKGSVALYVNGEFSMQWQFDPVDPDNEEGWKLGGGVGFRVDGDESPVRISDVVVAEWNGVPDSARSLENEERDVVLLTNGTDRVSGRIQSIANGRLTLDGPYAPMTIPVTEIADIRFASGSLRDDAENSGDRIRVFFQPVGVVSGVPGLTQDGRMSLKSKLLGDLSLSLDAAVALEFRQGGSFLDAWDDDL